MTAAVHEGSSGQRDLGTVALPYTFVNRERKGPTNSATVKVSVCWACRMYSQMLTIIIVIIII